MARMWGQDHRTNLAGAPEALALLSLEWGPLKGSQDQGGQLPAFPYFLPMFSFSSTVWNVHCVSSTHVELSLSHSIDPICPSFLSAPCRVGLSPRPSVQWPQHRQVSRSHTEGCWAGWLCAGHLSPQCPEPHAHRVTVQTIGSE